MPARPTPPPTIGGGRPRSVFALTVLALACAGALTACGPGSDKDRGAVRAVGAESQYADVIAQIGGRYVDVSAVIDNPNTDPHEFEASASVAEELSQAQLVVQNGAGYDDFMDKIEQASHRADRDVIVAQDVLGLPADVENPHLWYSPGTMPAVARSIADDLGRLDSAHKAYFQANLKRFTASLAGWDRAIAEFSSAHGKTAVAVTEPVANYMLQAAGTRVLTPPSLQLAIMNGTDPAPQDIARQDQLLSHHQVKVFLYNEQVTDSLTQGFLKLAQKDHVPVVAVYETMPIPGYDYQTWMEAEVKALARAVTSGVSTVKL